MNLYSYNCVDKSILLPYFKKYYVSLYFKLIPQKLTANFITLLSTGLIVFLFFFVNWRPEASSEIMAIVFALCLNGYIVGDHLDGMQAKQTNTSSSLGEFLDHYMDVYNGAIVFYIITIFFAPIPDLVFYGLLVLNCTAFAVTMVEELERKELYFGVLGTLEGVVLLIFFFILWLIPPIKEFWLSEIIAGYKAYWIVIIILGLGYALTIVDVLRRIKYSPRQFTVYSLLALILAYLLYSAGIDHLWGWLILALYSGEYIAKVMESYLLSKKHRHPDILISVLIIVLSICFFSKLISTESFQWILWSMTAYLSVKVIYLFAWIVYQQRQFWYWINPDQN